MCMDDLKLRPYANGALYHHEALNGTGYPNGVKSKQIPLEGKIIRVADEFDAIVSKRQYKSHIGITDTLKILFEETRTKVSSGIALKAMSEEASKKINKIEPKIFKALVKVIIDDTEYEAYCLTDYIKYLKENITRLEEVLQYKSKFEKISDPIEKKKFLAGMSILFQTGENFDNCVQVLSEYKEAYLVRSGDLDKLKQELKSIKKMR